MHSTRSTDTSRTQTEPTDDSDVPRPSRYKSVDTGDSVRIPDEAGGRRRYAKPMLTRQGTIVELTLGELVGEVENGGVLPFVFGSYGTG